jgi:2-hydroxychromene-2-carboxylate isomerase
MRVARVAEAAGVAVRWRPFLLGPIFAAQGWSDSPFNIYPAKGGGGILRASARRKACR